MQYLTSQSSKAVEMVLGWIKEYFDISKSFCITGNCKALLCYSCCRGKYLQPYSAASSGYWAIKYTVSENSINLFFLKCKASQKVVSASGKVTHRLPFYSLERGGYFCATLIQPLCVFFLKDSLF